MYERYEVLAYRRMLREKGLFYRPAEHPPIDPQAHLELRAEFDALMRIGMQIVDDIARRVYDLQGTSPLRIMPFIDSACSAYARIIDIMTSEMGRMGALGVIGTTKSECDIALRLQLDHDTTA